jgi:hypothetical protein
MSRLVSNTSSTSKPAFSRSWTISFTVANVGRPFPTSIPSLTRTWSGLLTSKAGSSAHSIVTNLPPRFRQWLTPLKQVLMITRTSS